MRKMSDFLKKKKPIIKELIARLNEKYAYVSVLGTDVCGTSIGVDAYSTYVRPASISECGFVIRVYQNAYSEYSINDINKQNTEESIKAVDELVGQKTSIEKVTGLIEVKVTPQRGRGFDNMAERIYNYPEVKAVYLLSGGYDLMVILEEKSLFIFIFTESSFNLLTLLLTGISLLIPPGREYIWVVEL